MSTTTKGILALFGLLVSFSIIGSVINTPKRVEDPNVQSNHAATMAQYQAQQDALNGVNCKKDGQAIIGESTKRTLKCGWGKPQRVNRTITGSMTREQWVYGNNNYLYFIEGRLTAIQN